MGGTAIAAHRNAHFWRVSWFCLLIRLSEGPGRREGVRWGGASVFPSGHWKVFCDLRLHRSRSFNVPWGRSCVFFRPFLFIFIFCLPFRLGFHSFSKGCPLLFYIYILFQVFSLHGLCFFFFRLTSQCLDLGVPSGHSSASSRISAVHIWVSRTCPWDTPGPKQGIRTLRTPIINFAALPSLVGMSLAARFRPATVWVQGAPCLILPVTGGGALFNTVCECWPSVVCCCLWMLPCLVRSVTDGGVLFNTVCDCLVSCCLLVPVSVPCLILSLSVGVALFNTDCDCCCPVWYCLWLPVLYCPLLSVTANAPAAW